MKKFGTVTSIAAVWLQPNVDTDTLAPMKRIVGDYELADFVFEPFRYIDGDGDRGILNPDFPLNQPKYSKAEVLVVGENFGCGSSREPAAIGIARMGFRCLIGISFGGIFQKNCFQQGVLPIVLPRETIEKIISAAGDSPVSVDLGAETITCVDGSVFPFHVDTVQRERLLEGISDIEYTMKRRAAVEEKINAEKAGRPWVYDADSIKKTFSPA